MMNAHKITAEFENALREYTGAPYCVAVDNQSNALFLCLTYWKECERAVEDDTICIPSNTYPSVACEIKHAGLNVRFQSSNQILAGEYCLNPSNVWDSALRLTSNMYREGQMQCLSFTGPYKHLKLGKGGAILTDNEHAYKWFKKARFSGRSECSYHEDNFDDNPVVGWNMYMMPEIAARGLLLMNQFYDKGGNPKHNEDLELPYPNLSLFKLWQ